MIKEIKKIRSKISNNLSQMATGLYVVVAMLGTMGVLMVIGNILTNQTHIKNEKALIWFKLIGQVGSIVFQLMPLLFTMAIVLAFTKEPIAVFASVVGWFSLLSFSSVLITKGVDNFYYAFSSIKIEGGNAIGNRLGFNTLDPGIFWAFIISPLTVWIYKKVKDIKLPVAFQIIEGERLVAPVLAFAMVPLTILFVLIWPFINNGIYAFANSTSKWPRGLDSFAFATIDKAALPFGLHHAVYPLFFYSSAGGHFSGFESFDKNFIDSNGHVWKSGVPVFQIFDNLKVTNAGSQYMHFLNGDSNYSGLFKSNINGDINILYKFSGNTQIDYSFIQEHLQIPNDIQDYKNSLLNNTAYDGGFNSSGFSLGRYSGGWFIGILGQFGAMLAIVLLSKKENRKRVFSLLGGAMIPLLFGITEPFVFTFLFTAPWLYFLIYIPLQGMDVALGNLFSIHAETASGLITLITTGIIPSATGQKTNWYMSFAGGGISLILYFVAFYLAIYFGKLNTPGRNSNEEIKFATKKEALSKLGLNNNIKRKNSKNNKELIQAKNLLDSLGGFQNILDFRNCASRMRIKIKNKLKADESKIKALDSHGFIWVDKNNIQVIYGTTVQRVRREFDLLMEKNGKKN